MKVEKSTKKYIDITQEEIDTYINNFRIMINNRKYIISMNSNRKENEVFMNDYKITIKKAEEMLLEVKTEDFCYAVDNKNIDYEHEKLYIFCRSFTLNKQATEEVVEVYMKLNVTKSKSKEDYLVIISFHKRNKPIKKLFV